VSGAIVKQWGEKHGVTREISDREMKKLMDAGGHGQDLTKVVLTEAECTVRRFPKAIILSNNDTGSGYKTRSL
jgi:hypothetical protein